MWNKIWNEQHTRIAHINVSVICHTKGKGNLEKSWEIAFTVLNKVSLASFYQTVFSKKLMVLVYKI